MSDQTFPDRISSAGVDALVAHHAPIGRQQRRRRLLTWKGLVVLVPLMGVDHGQALAAELGDILQQLVAVDQEVLDEMRGGIDLGEDYTIAIGITRTTSVNGIEQFSSAMYMNDLAYTVGSGVAQAAPDPVIIQNGDGNFIAMDTLSAMSPAITTIIQNTLDNQAIANETVLDVSLQNVATVTQGLHLSQIVNESLTRQP
jgi:hypothetical protein